MEEEEKDVAENPHFYLGKGFSIMSAVEGWKGRLSLYTSLTCSNIARNVGERSDFFAGILQTYIVWVWAWV